MIAYLYFKIANFNVPTWDKFDDQRRMQRENAAAVFSLIEYMYLFFLISFIYPQLRLLNKLFLIFIPLIFIFAINVYFFKKYFECLDKIYEKTSKSKKLVLLFIWLILFFAVFLGLRIIRG